MKKQKFDPFKNLVLDEEEQQIEDALARDEFEEDPDFENTKKMLQEAVAQYKQLHASKPVTLRVNQLDLIKIKAKAKRKQIPYQTLLGALLHNFAQGKTNISI